MTLKKVLLAVSCVVCFAVSGFSDPATGIINSPTSGIGGVTTVLSNSPITQNGYLQIQTTLYRRIVTGVLWNTKVTYRAKTCYYYSRVLNYDNTDVYNTSKIMQVTRTNGQIDNLRHTIQPYVNVSLAYIWTTSTSTDRDMYQFIFAPELNSNVYTSYGGYTATIKTSPTNSDWENKYTNITDGKGYPLQYTWPKPN